MKQVLIAGNVILREIFEGVAEYACEQKWHLDANMYYFPSYRPYSPKYEGAIVVHGYQDEFLRPYIKQLKCPVVFIDDYGLRTKNQPIIYPNPGEIAQNAFTHLRNRGFSNFMTLGGFHESRLSAFKKIAKENGFPCEKIGFSGTTWEKEHEILKAKITKVSEPTAVFCERDDFSSFIFEVASELKLKIPEELAVIGCGNDNFANKIGLTPLSTIDLDYFNLGYKAADMLQKQLNGETIANAPILFPTKGVISRQSTSVFACNNPIVADAIDFMQQHFAEFITIEDLVHKLGITRNGLEKAFNKNFGLPPGEILRKIRLETACRLLRESSDKIGAISFNCGYPNQRNFATSFRKEYKTTPKAYRKRYQKTGPS